METLIKLAFPEICIHCGESNNHNLHTGVCNKCLPIYYTCGSEIINLVSKRKNSSCIHEWLILHPYGAVCLKCMHVIKTKENKSELSNLCYGIKEFNNLETPNGPNKNSTKLELVKSVSLKHHWWISVGLDDQSEPP